MNPRLLAAVLLSTATLAGYATLPHDLYVHGDWLSEDSRKTP